MMRLGLQSEDPVPAVDAAAHNEIGGHSLFPVRGQPQNDASARVAVGRELFSHIADFVNIHVLIPLFHFEWPHRPVPPPGEAAAIPPAP